MTPVTTAYDVDFLKNTFLVSDYPFFLHKSYFRKLLNTLRPSEPCALLENVTFRVNAAKSKSEPVFRIFSIGGYVVKLLAIGSILVVSKHKLVSFD